MRQSINTNLVAYHLRHAFLVVFSINLLVAGCGEKPSQEAEQTPATEDQGAATPLPASNASAATAPAKTDSKPLELADEPDAIHPVAGRSPFPSHGEMFGELISAKRLSDIDPFSPEIDGTDIPNPVPWQQAKHYVGYEITVAGTIVSTGQSRDGQVNFLNFHEDWRGKFYMVLFDDLANTLDQSVSEQFSGKEVRVTGVVELHRNRPQLKILSMDQVKFID